MKLGLGTAALGRPQYINLRQNESVSEDLELFRAQSFSVLEDAYKRGIRYFDTAPGYGLAENLLLDWLQTKNDESIQVATKWGYTYVANFDAEAKVHEIKEHSLKKLDEQWENSKAFLPRLKVYQIHSATLDTGVLENDAVLNRLAFLKNEYNFEIGITTTGANQVEVIKKAVDVSVEGNQLFDAFQVTYNMLDQNLNSISNELQKQNKRIIIKEALANGRVFRNAKYTHYNELYATLESLASKYNVGVDAISLRFCEQTIQGSIILSGASSAKQLEQNLKIDLFHLSEHELEKLNTFRVKAEQYWQERKQLSWN
jgi:aryl-alcohol dehydrogenase-like predicted oxidoreductase|tara:strand:- start:869 stop:1813 length:945 start_codon:yes stop_codon:yes gene_type:complete